VSEGVMCCWQNRPGRVQKQWISTTNDNRTIWPPKQEILKLYRWKYNKHLWNSNGKSRVTLRPWRARKSAGKWLRQRL